MHCGKMVEKSPNSYCKVKSYSAKSTFYDFRLLHIGILFSFFNFFWYFTVVSKSESWISILKDCVLMA